MVGAGHSRAQSFDHTAAENGGSGNPVARVNARQPLALEPAGPGTVRLREAAANGADGSEAWSPK